MFMSSRPGRIAANHDAMTHFAKTLFAFPLLAAHVLAQAPAAPITFPADGGVLDVRTFGAVPNDVGDDTAAIQKALDEHPAGNRIVYLPPGTWVVSETLKWPTGSHGGLAQKRTILQGAGEKLSILKLPDAAAGFDQGSTPKALIWTGNKPAQRFRNAVRDLTIDVGARNPGAIGLQFNASNQGCIRNVTIRAAKDSGLIGLDMGFTDEIGPLLVRNLTVEGFETGIVTKWPVNSVTFEHIHLRGQRKLGWHNYHQMIFVRGLTSQNAVPAIYNEKDSWGTVSLVDSKLVGTNPPAKTPGILNQRQLYVRNVEISGYPVSVDNADKGRDKGDIAAPGRITEDTSHKNVVGQFREISDGTFATAGTLRRLPAKEVPAIPWGDPAKDWANLVKFGADPTGKEDASAALQRAIDSGAKTIYLPAGAEFRFDGEVELRGPVQRIIGLEGRFVTDGKAVWRLVDGKHPRRLPDAPAVIIERANCRSGGHGVRIEHASQRSLVVSSWIGADVFGRGKGDIFLDDFCGRLELEQPGQSAWCRQLNTEHTGTMLRNNGGKLWILGMKTEKIGTIIETVNGGHTDATGIFIYSNQGWTEGLPAFVIENSTAILAGLNERNYNRNPVSLWFRETQAGETRDRKETAWVYLSK
jgi:hypothetical protein